MKKAMIAIVSAVYVVAIVIVAFLGVRAEISNITILVDNIQLLDLEDKEAGASYTYYQDPLDTKTRVYTVAKRPNEEDISEAEYSLWNLQGRKFDYAYKIFGFKTVYDGISWRDGATHFKVNAKAYPSDATKKELIYTLTGQEENVVTINKDNGEITFNKKLTSNTIFQVAIRATDKAATTININFVVAAYR